MLTVNRKQPENNSELEEAYNALNQMFLKATQEGLFHPLMMLSCDWNIWSSTCNSSMKRDNFPLCCLMSL
jgi:hypothetical protein